MSEEFGWVFLRRLGLGFESQRWYHGTSEVRARVCSSIEIGTDSGTIIEHEPAQVRLGWELETEPGLETGLETGVRPGERRRVETRRRGLVRLWCDCGEG